MLKEVTPVNRIFMNASMSGLISVTSLASNIAYKDSVAIQYSWTGNPTGTFDLQGSVDYNPGQPQSNGTFNAGNWVSLTLSPAPIALGSQSVLINCQQLAFPWCRTVYTNTSGSGLLSGVLFAKSLG
jgi:hypothetical protein